MPFYELMLVLRPMPKQEVVDCLKRAANIIWKESGVINRIEYFGLNKLPYTRRGQNEDEKIYEGSYFLYHLSMSNVKIINLRPELKLELDIVRFFGSLSDESKVPEDYDCTLEEELRPPAFRKSVQPLLEEKNVRAGRRS